MLRSQAGSYMRVYMVFAMREQKGTGGASGSERRSR